MGRGGPKLPEEVSATHRNNRRCNKLQTNAKAQPEAPGYSRGGREAAPTAQEHTTHISTATHFGRPSTRANSAGGERCGVGARGASEVLDGTEIQPSK